MIKINLLGSKIEQNPYLICFMTSWIAGLIIFFLSLIFWKISLLGNLKELEEKNSNLKKELEVLEEKTKEVKDIEDIKNELNEKLQVINILKKSKLGPVKLLDDLNISLPEKVWIESIQETNNNILITGKSLDDQSLSRFMKLLEKSAYFTNIDLQYSKQFFMEDVKIKDFELKAKISYSGNEAKKDDVKSDNNDFKNKNIKEK